MLARRIGLGIAALVLVIVVIVSVVDRVEDGDRARAPQPTKAAPARDVTGELPADGTVRATVGDVVTLTVTTPEDDEVVIDGLGEELDTAADVPETMHFVAFTDGDFAVVAESSGQTLGRLVVAPAPKA